MKNTPFYLSLVSCLAFVACTYIAPVDMTSINQQGQIAAQELAEKQDVIETLKTYWDKYERRCEAYTGGYGETERCFFGDAFVEQGIDLGCINEWRNAEYYNSDVCIDTRKNLRNSIVEYFDYNRFLPKPNKIRTDNDFYRLALYYRHIYDCKNIKNATEQQVEDCKKQIMDISIEIASKGAKCSKMYKFTGEYEQYLYDQNTMYKWAINHDPNSRYYYREGKIMRFNNYCPRGLACHFDYSNTFSSPVHNKQTALKGLETNIKEFGRVHMCDISDWQDDIRRLEKKYSTSFEVWQQKLEFEWQSNSSWLFNRPGIYNWVLTVDSTK